MNILVGLGNPGEKYQHTRHNAGFIFAESIRQQLELPGWVLMKKTQSLICKNTAWMLIEPQQFMNQSGLAVRGVLDYYYKFSEMSQEQKTLFLQSFFVAHDDLDLQLGTFKVQLGKGPKVHNGLKSMYEHLGGSAFWHVRLGIDGRTQSMRQQGRDYVLEDFMSEERQEFKATIDQAGKRMLECAKT